MTEAPDSRNFVRLYELFTAGGDSHDIALERAGTATGSVVSVRVNGPPRSGKTALLGRIEDVLREHGYTCAAISPRDHELRVLLPPPPPRSF